MISGIGTDLCRIPRIERAIDRFGEKFARKILVDDEFHRFRKLDKPGAFLAKRFAAKEAFSKALGTGLRFPVTWRNVELWNDPSGKPGLKCLGPLCEFVEERGITGIHVSLADEPDFALAFVILECS